ncbi:hypothetical protein ACTMTJ_13500 [Phytohabitans sp. LJ34]|uniref:hypothetical protein n=1 Tax=Phytohabitans sp. LJ34 TaxID=3452217 RepID=UPI003F8CA167
MDAGLPRRGHLARSASLAEDYEKLKLRAVSVFEHLSEEVVDAGFARIEAALPSLDPGPPYETNELLVFRTGF